MKAYGLFENASISCDFSEPNSNSMNILQAALGAGSYIYTTLNLFEI